PHPLTPVRPLKVVGRAPLVPGALRVCPPPPPETAIYGRRVRARGGPAPAGRGYRGDGCGTRPSWPRGHPYEGVTPTNSAGFAPPAAGMWHWALPTAN